MTYPAAIQYLESFINYENIPSYPYKESLKLERIKDFLDTIGNPQEFLKCLHIAGTKGKGSTCVFIAYILREAGYKVGLYTSPHLSDFRERIRILSSKPQALSYKLEFEGMISLDELIDLVERLKPSIEKYNKNSKYGPLSFFEVYTSLAFVYFKEKEVDFAVLETGLGGRLDATNIVSPLICAITPISYEHTQKLGNTLREIAAEKAGIIKTQNSIVISAPQAQETGEVIRNRCKEAGVKLYEVGKDIKFQAKVESGDRGEFQDYQSFDIESTLGSLKDLKIQLLGRHQITNATLAVSMALALNNFCQAKIDFQAVREGLFKAIWPGRCEVISKEPLVVLDGAQNIASSLALKQAINENFRYKKLILILGISNDKDISGICSQLYDLADEIILTQSNNPRASEPEILVSYFKGKRAFITHSVKEAKLLAERHAKRDDLILVSGSLFVVGEFRDDKI